MPFKNFLRSNMNCLDRYLNISSETDLALLVATAADAVVPVAHADDAAAAEQSNNVDI